MTDKNRATPEKGSPRTLPTTPDPAAAKDLRLLLDGRWASIRDTFRKSISGETGAKLLHDPTLSMDEAREAMLGKLGILAETEMQKGVFAPENGGEGDTGATLTGLEMVGYADLSTMVKGGVQWGLWGGAVDALGTERHSHYVQDIIDLKLLGCFGMTERGHGSDVQNIETTATYDPETKEFIVDSPTPSAEKVYIGNAAKHGRMATVFAQLYTPGVKESHGVHCLLVPIRDEEGNTLPGVTIGDHGHKGGLLGVDNGTLSFDKVRVPREALLNRFGDVSEDGVYSSPIESRNRRFFTMLGTLIRGRVAVGAAGGAATRASLTIALRYAMRRRQFEGLPGKEKRLIDHRAHRLRLLPRLARSYALAMLQNQMIERLHDQTSAINRGEWDVANPTEEQLRKQRETESRAAAVKVAATAHATDTIQECREACGGAGYMAENRLTIFKADSDVFTTFEGDNTVLLQLVGKEMITAYARDLSELSPIDMVKFSVESISDVLRQRTSIPLTVQSLIDRVSDREDNSLFDAGYQIKIIQEREYNLLKSLARRLKDAKKMEPADAVKLVDKAQDHLIDLAWARIDSMLIEALVEAEEELPKDSPAFPVLEQVRHLFAFSTILKHAGWYQEQNILTGNRTKAARAAVNDLVDSIGPWSGVLVDAFGIPDVLVDVPMLNDSGVDPVK
ncbi:acyl-CoA dehydrogenase family protein [Corynebacterium mastitidis]